jgi:hypothetical protein
MQNTLNFIKTTTRLKGKFLKMRSIESIKDVHVENLVVQKNIVNVIKLDFYVDKSVNVYNVKITNL